MTRVDRRISGGKQGEEGRLRCLQVEGRLAVAADADTVEVRVPRRSRILTEIVGVLSHQLVPSALHVPAGKRLAIVPRDALPKLERELGLVGIPGPAFGQVGNDVR